jgi:hypothetical protein
MVAVVPGVTAHCPFVPLGVGTVNVMAESLQRSMLRWRHDLLEAAYKELLTPLSATNTKTCYDFLLRKATKCVKVLVVNIELIWSKSCGSQSAMRDCSVMRRITYLDREMP